MMRIALLLLLITLTGCEKVIDIDLNSVDPQLVIETDILYPQNEIRTQISYTTDYFEPQTAEYVDDASVTVNGPGVSIELEHTGNGEYFAASELVLGNYHVAIEHSNTIYESEVTLLDSISISSLSAAEVEETQQGPQGQSSSETMYTVSFAFQDIPDIDNYFMLRFSTEGFDDPDAEFQTLDDWNNDGNLIVSTIGFGRQAFPAGNTVFLTLFHIDKSVYDFYKVLEDLTSAQGNPLGGSVAPGNPTSNWTGGGLGLCGAFSADQQSITLPL